MVSPTKLRSLLLTPVTPAKTGNGLAMRAAAARDALTAFGEVDTLLVPVAEGPGVGSEQVRTLALSSGPNDAASWLRYARGRKLVQEVGRLPARARLAAPGTMDEDTLSREYDLVYVLRLYLAGIALPLMEQKNQCHFLLDLDEDDAAVAKQIGELLEERGEQERARRQCQEAILLEEFADACLPWFDTVAYSTCTEATARKRHGITQIVLPNIVHCVEKCPKSSAHGPIRMLFVGNLDYRPNLDALRRIVEVILPELRRTDSLAELWVVGSGGRQLKEEHGNAPGVTWLGYVQDLSVVYPRTSVAVVPLRAGGGSRLKILEAMAWGLPVVATPKAVEGLDVTQGRHVLLANSDAELVEAVKRLANCPELATALTRSAFTFVQQEHSPETLHSKLACVLNNAGKRN